MSKKNDTNMVLDPSLPVTMSNLLVESRSSFTLFGIKLLRLTIMQVLKDETDFQTYKVRVSELEKMLGVDRHNIYATIYDTLRGLYTTSIVIGDGDPKHNYIGFGWLQDYEYKDGVVTIRLHEDLKPYLLQLKNNFTIYALADVLALKTVPAIRIYELLQSRIMHKLADKEATIYLSLEELQGITGTLGKYANTGSFVDRILKPAIDDINSYHTNENGRRIYRTSIHISEITPRKEGRKIVGYDFKIITPVDYEYRLTGEAHT